MADVDVEDPTCIETGLLVDLARCVLRAGILNREISSHVKAVANMPPEIAIALGSWEYQAAFDDLPPEIQRLAREGGSTL